MWHEVLATEDPSVIQVLQAAAVTERVNASLAEALTGRADAGHLLLVASARGLFVTRFGSDGWFEVHSFVRAVLVADLRERAPGELATLHARAARWFEDADEVALALEHWLQAGDARTRVRLLAAKHAELYDSGREATVVRMVAAIPQHVATADIEAMIEFAWCHLLISRHRFVELVEQSTWWAGRSSLDPALMGRVVMLRAFAATIRGRWDEGGTLARQAMADLGDGWWRDPLGRFGWNMVAREIALAERWSEGSDEVREVQLALSRDVARRLAFEGTRALGEAISGRPLDALRIIAGVRKAAAVSQMTILHAELATAEALADRELGDRPRAVAALRLLADTPAETMVYCRALAAIELAEAWVDEGNLEAAEAAFRQAEDLIETELPAAGTRGWLARAGTVVAIAAGDLERACRWAEQSDDGFWRPISTARVCLAGGERRDAWAALETAVPRCRRHEVVLGLLRARAADDHEEAMKAVSAAIDLAAGEGLLQTVAVRRVRGLRAGRAGGVAGTGAVGRPPSPGRRRATSRDIGAGPPGRAPDGARA